jgi:nitrile hydratase
MTLQFKSKTWAPKNFLDRRKDEAMEIDREIATMPGTAALPRKNGELIFSEPWEGRVFGMAITLHREGTYPWEEFQTQLIAEINSADCKSGSGSDYYEHWLAAFEKLLLEKGIMTRTEFECRKAEFASGEREEVF